jgi:flagellar basal-body rod protein FlgC
MGLFDAMSTADTGANVSQTWIDAISNNIANMNDVAPTSGPAYQAEFVQAAAIPGGQLAGGTALGSGTEVVGVAHSSAAGVVEYDPSSPMADKLGMVRVPDVNLGTQMTDLIMAQRGFEANIATVTRAQQAYQAALNLK